MIHILTDSCSDLDQGLLQSVGIDVINLSVFIDNQVLKDRAEINTQELFALVEKTGVLPKTSAPSIAEFVQFFEREGDIIFIGISDKLSATVNNALIAVESLPERNIRIINSSNLSTGIGLLAMKAAELRNQGCTTAEIEAKIIQSIRKVHTSFVIDTLDYLYKGGRCSAMAMIMGSLLKIRPVIEVRQDGTLGVREKITGTRRKALNSLIAEFKAHLEELDPHRVFITHTGCDQDALFLSEEVHKLAPVEHLEITTAGATIASHCGPNTIGLLYLTK